MIQDFVSPTTPRGTLFALAGCFGVLLAAWLSIWAIDLHDGRTWNKRGRHGTGPLLYVIDKTENPSGFRITVMSRYVLPVTLLGTISLVCLLGALSQPKRNAE